MKNLSVVGIGSTTFGQHKSTSITALAKKAASEAILDAGIDKKRIGALYVGNFVSGPLNGQEVLGGILTNALGWEQYLQLKLRSLRLRRNSISTCMSFSSGRFN